jgi:ABC-type methionine transport system ATPase subunit
MNLAFINFPKNTASKLTYDVLIENEPDGTMKATLLGLPDYQCFGATQEEAINNLIQLVQQRNPKIVTLEIEYAEEAEHPWMKFAGMHKDNPLFDEVIAYIEEERNAINSQMQEIHAEFINEIDQQLEKTGVNNADEIMKMFYLTQRNRAFDTNDTENNV